MPARYNQLLDLNATESIFKALGNSNNLGPGDIVNANIALTSSLQDDLNNIHTIAGLIIGGVPTGILAPVAGSAQTFVLRYQSVSSSILVLNFGFVIWDASSVYDLADKINQTLLKAISYLS